MGAARLFGFHTSRRGRCPHRPAFSTSIRSLGADAHIGPPFRLPYALASPYRGGGICEANDGEVPPRRSRGSDTGKNLFSCPVFGEVLSLYSKSTQRRTRENRWFSLDFFLFPPALFLIIGTQNAVPLSSEEAKRRGSSPQNGQRKPVMLCTSQALPVFIVISFFAK